MPSTSYTVIPISERRRVGTFEQMSQLVDEHKLGRKVSELFADGSRRLRAIVKPILTKYATDNDGKTRRNWKDMSSTEQAQLTTLVNEVEPRLARHFQGAWATDWIIKRQIDYRVANGKRDVRPKKHKADGRRPKGAKRGKLIIY